MGLSDCPRRLIAWWDRAAPQSERAERVDPTSNVQFGWQAHPARERLGAAAAGLTVMVAVGVLVVAICRMDGLGPQASILWGLAAMGFVLATTSRFYFRSRYSINADGIIADYPLRKTRLRWRDVRRFAFDDRGGILSRRTKPSMLDAVQGIPLMFDQASREQAIQSIRSHLPATVKLIDARKCAKNSARSSNARGAGTSGEEVRSWAG